jgi:hypothetical protein
VTYPRHFAQAALAGLVFFAAPAIPVVKANIGLTALVAIERWSGVAIDGYDPVAYFTEGQPRLGSRQLEVVWRDAAWRFANEGNRAAFEAHPEIYSPRFGGFDPNAVARGVLVAGDVHIFALGPDQQLYLFRDEESRLAFLTDREIGAKANRVWEDIQRQVVP